MCEKTKNDLKVSWIIKQLNLDITHRLARLEISNDPFNSVKNNEMCVCVHYVLAYNVCVGNED